MMKVTPFNFQLDGIDGDLFTDLYRLLLANEISAEEVLKIFTSAQKRLSHASLKLPFVEGRPSIEKAISIIMKIDSDIAKKIKKELKDRAAPSLDDFINEKFGISHFQEFFPDLQRMRMNCTLMNFRNELVGEKSQDSGVDYLECTHRFIEGQFSPVYRYPGGQLTSVWKWTFGLLTKADPATPHSRG